MQVFVVTCKGEQNRIGTIFSFSFQRDTETFFFQIYSLIHAKIMIFAKHESLNQLTQCMYNELFIWTMLFRGHLTVALGTTKINSCIVR